MIFNMNLDTLRVLSTQRMIILVNLNLVLKINHMIKNFNILLIRSSCFLL